MPKHLARRGVQQRRFFEFPFHLGQSEADDQHDPGHGRHAMDPNGASPSFQQHGRETGQRVPSLQTEAGLPRRRLKIERHEEHQPQSASHSRRPSRSVLTNSQAIAVPSGTLMAQVAPARKRVFVRRCKVRSSTTDALLSGIPPFWAFCAKPQAALDANCPRLRLRSRSSQTACFNMFSTGIRLGGIGCRCYSPALLSLGLVKFVVRAPATAVLHP